MTLENNGLPQHLMDDILEAAHVESQMDDALWCVLWDIDEEIAHIRHIKEGGNLAPIGEGRLKAYGEIRDNLIANLDRAWGM